MAAMNPDAPADNLTLPDGSSVPSSPENRQRARALWAADNEGPMLENEAQIEIEELQVKKLQEELNAQRHEYELQQRIAAAEREAEAKVQANLLADSQARQAELERQA